jgi:putative transposase
VKKRYQIDKQAALNRFCQQAQQPQAQLQLVLPLADIVAWAQQGAGEVMRQGLRLLMKFVMDQEVSELVGDKHSRGPQRQAYRWGREQGYCVIDGQKVPLPRPRVRDQQNREVPLGSYELFQRGALIEDTVWRNLMHGLTTRNYAAVVRQFVAAYGIEKSMVSEHFIRASRRKLEQLLTRPLDELALCAILIDGTIYQGQNLVVALGIGCDGRKTVLGLRQGASENATVVGALLGDLQERGLDFSIPRLYVLDGAKALAAAVRRFAGEAAVVQRCQAHKVRNVVEHLSEQYQSAVRYKMLRAYRMLRHEDAQHALDQLHRELLDLNPDAARSLKEGMAETLTLHRLGAPEKLRRSLATTNVLESTFSMVETVCRNVKRWRGADQRLRWVASALLHAEERWKRLGGYREIPQLLQQLHAAAPPNASRQASQVA